MDQRFSKTLHDFILQEVSKRPSKDADPKNLTIGLEQEFFLLDLEGRPATHEASQKFLLALSHQPGWHIHERLNGALGDMMWRCSIDTPDGRYTAVKYDHHPHLMEVAFAYESNLGALAKTVHETFKTFSRIAEKTGTQVDHRPQINVDGNLSSVVSPLSYYRDLRYYRSKLFSFRGESESTALNFTNYAALIAATQIHVGGTKWWLQNNLVGTLHCLEPYISRYASDGFQNQNKKQVLKARWTGYGRVFAGYPLIGFPELEKWNTEVWIGALLRSPLAGGPEDEWAGLSLEKYGKIPFGSWSKAFPLIRDLQIIRPRLFGTLEFRADPAQPSIERVLGLTALRLGLVASLLGGKTPTPVTFGIAKTNWWALVRGSELEGQHPPLLDCAREALKERGNGEEVFLNVFDKIS